jgi:hypothetical protein
MVQGLSSIRDCARKKWPLRGSCQNQNLNCNYLIGIKRPPARRLEPTARREITNYKHPQILKLGQINSKLQYPNFKQDQKPSVWSVAVGLVIVICYLEIFSR